MAECAPTDSPAMLVFSIDRETGAVAILNSANCACGAMHVTRVQLDIAESEAVGEVLFDLLIVLRYAERSVDVTDLSAFINDVSQTVRGL